MTPTRIGFDARYINDRYQGIGRYAYHLIEAVTRLDGNRSYVLFTGKGPDTRFGLEKLAGRPNVEICPGPWPLYWPHEQLLWPGLLKGRRGQRGIDLFHSPYIVAPLLAAHARVIITVHDLIFERYPEYMPNAGWRPYYNFLMRGGLRAAQAVVCVSEATRADLEVFYPGGTAPRVVISEGVDDHFWQAPPNALVSRIVKKYQLQTALILTVGARRPHKNHTRLVEAFASIAGQIPHDLIFVGPPDARFPDDTCEAVHRLQLTGRVRFFEWVAEDELPTFYRLADLVVLPSIIEGFGLPALEAMASGTAVLAAGNTAFPEVMGLGNGAGVLFDPLSSQEMAAEMIRLLTDPDQRQRIAAAGQERARHFTWEKAAAGIIALYDQALA